MERARFGVARSWSAAASGVPRMGHAGHGRGPGHMQVVRGWLCGCEEHACGVAGLGAAVACRGDEGAVPWLALGSKGAWRWSLVAVERKTMQAVGRLACSAG